MRLIVPFLFLFLLVSGFTIGSKHFETAAQEKEVEFPDAGVKKQIAAKSLLWNKACRNSDAGILKELYDVNAHYLPNDDQSYHGIEEILASWEASIPYLKGMKLQMESLEGTKDLLYETGTGHVSVLGGDGEVMDLTVKYVNVWKLQEDGSYKVVIDTYNNVQPE